MKLVRLCTRPSISLLLLSVAFSQPALAQKTKTTSPVHVNVVGANGKVCTPLTSDKSGTSLASTPVHPYGSLTPKPVVRVPPNTDTDAHQNEGDDPTAPPTLHDLGPENNEDGARDFMQAQGDNQNAMAGNATSTQHGATPANNNNSQTSGPTTANGDGCKPSN